MSLEQPPSEGEKEFRPTVDVNDLLGVDQPEVEVVPEVSEEDLPSSSTPPTQFEIDERVRVETYRRTDEKYVALGKIAERQVTRWIEEAPPGADRMDYIQNLMAGLYEQLEQEHENNKGGLTEDRLDHFRTRLDLLRKALWREVETFAEQPSEVVEQRLGLELEKRVEKKWLPRKKAEDLLAEEYGMHASIEGGEQVKAMLLSKITRDQGPNVTARLVREKVVEACKLRDEEWAEAQRKPSEWTVLPLIDDEPSLQEVNQDSHVQAAYKALQDYDDRLLVGAMVMFASGFGPLYNEPPEIHALADDHYLRILGRSEPLQNHRDAYMTAVRPLVRQRMDVAKTLPIMDLSKEGSIVEGIPRGGMTVKVDLGEVVDAPGFEDWAGTPTSPDFLKNTISGPMQSREYAEDLAIKFLTGEYVYESKGDLLDLYRYQLPNGRYGYAVNGGQHRSAAFKALGWRFLNAHVS